MSQERYDQHKGYGHNHGTHNHPQGRHILGITSVDLDNGGLYVDVQKQTMYAWTGLVDNDQATWQPIWTKLTPELLLHVAEVFSWIAQAAEDFRHDNKAVQAALDAYEALSQDQKHEFLQRRSSAL